MTEAKHGIARRGVLAAGLAAPAMAAAARAAEPDPIKGMTVVNALGGLNSDSYVPPAGDPPMSTIVDTRPGMVDDRSIGDHRKAGLSAVVVTVGHVSGPADPFEHTVREVGRWQEILRANSATTLPIRTAADILRARDERRLGVILCFQNSLMLGDRADRVDIFHDLGVRQFQLTYNLATPLGDGSMAPQNRGLTRFGREVVARLNAKRGMIDLSHSGERICLDAIAASKAPIVISHTGCRALAESPRNKTDAELRGVAEKGGFVGIYFMPFLTPGRQPTGEDVVAHIEHALKVCGEDHVGIGTDGGASEVDFEATRKEQAAYVELRRSQGIAATGESADILFLVPDLSGPNQYRRLARLLAKRGHPSRRIEKILGGNYVRAAREIWGG
ncbi:dipeptidase [Caulobacter mirabilis]|uniref:Peptidase M19 n=1 Tax=Caulobacter mirabilis TaxID=69666 RepID=A0A2D2AYV0_9CAUL|nr:membrane dipeptidase [Caulobacter mirabilis]ATQ43198.1 peptidase M19 [Caulobacter mirabilis]